MKWEVALITGSGEMVKVSMTILEILTYEQIPLNIVVPTSK